MPPTLFRWTAIAILAVGFPIAAWADLSQTTTLQANTLLNMDTGATSPSPGVAGPNILWDGSSITPQSGTTAVDIGVGAPFGTFTQTVLAFLPGYSSAPIPAATLRVNYVFGVHTSTGHYAKVLVTAKSGTSITLQFTTFGVAPGANGTPTITGILNNSSNVPKGFPNYGIAPSSIFVVTGNALSDAGAPVLQSSADPGLPLMLNGASIAVTVNGVTTRPALYYTSPGKLAAVLPAATPAGNGTLTVTHGGLASAPAAIQVVPNALGINTYIGAGVATDGATGSLITYTNSASPGQTIILWTTGLGADPADSDTIFAAAPHSVNAPLHIYIGGVEAAILYQGSAGYPGVNQINLTIPQSAPTGCFVSLAAVIGSQLNHAVVLPINNGGGACLDAASGLSGSQISPPAGQTLRTGLVAIGQGNAMGRSGPTVTDFATAAFVKYTGLYTPNSPVSPGSCTANDLSAASVPSVVGMDVGTIALTGPAGLSLNLSPSLIKGTFSSMLAASSIPQSGGTFTFKASGGADVGPFTSTIMLANPIMTLASPSGGGTFDRTQGLTIAWTGGNPGTYVYMSGTSVVVTGGTEIIGEFRCVAPVEAGQFTVPSYILSALPASSNGGISVQNIVQLPLSASGLDIGVAQGSVSYSISGTYR